MSSSFVAWIPMLVADPFLFYPQSTEEIELEIDLLPASVLTKLYNFVIQPPKAAQRNPSSSFSRHRVFYRPRICKPRGFEPLKR